MITTLINAQECGNGSRANSSNSDVSDVSDVSEETIIPPSSRSVTVSQQDIDSVITCSGDDVTHQNKYKHVTYRKPRRSKDITFPDQNHNVSINGQLNEIRKNYRQKYKTRRDNEHTAGNTVPLDKHKWPPNTCLIVGDSILSGLQENRMSKRSLVKVRVFKGSRVADFYHYLEPLLQKSPSKIIFHAATNDAVSKESAVIIDELLQLKFYVAGRYPECNFIISCPTIRTDNHAANITLRNLRTKLKELKIPIICNDNIDSDCLGRGGLHLNEKGSGKLAVNFISYNRRY